MSNVKDKKQICPVCKGEHSEYYPHKETQYYRRRFYECQHRGPTYADMVAHCDSLIIKWYKEFFSDEWTEPEYEKPIKHFGTKKKAINFPDLKNRANFLALICPVE